MSEINCIKILEPEKIEILKTQMPVPKKGEALLKLLYGGICGSDLNAYKGLSPYVTYPVIPGHEFSAEIVSIEDNEFGLKEGMIVTTVPYFNCKKCYSCERGFVNCCTSNQTMGVQRDGGFAEYITMPIEKICDGKGIKPKALSMIEPFCIGYHGIKRADIKASETVLVIGAGAIGIFAAISAKLMGAKVFISDISQEKLDNALTFGIDGIILNDSEESFKAQVDKATENKGFDVTVEAVGLASTFKNAIDAVAFRGRVVLIGVSKQTLDFGFTIIQTKELSIMGSRNALKKEFEELIDIVSQGKIDIEKIITKVYNYKDAPEAFEYLKDNIASTLKIVFEF